MSNEINNPQGLDQAFQKAFSQEAPNLGIPNPQVPQQAVPQQDTAPVNVINPEGRIVSIPSHQVNDALEAGYQLASDEHVAEQERKDKYDTTGQKLKTFAEGAGNAATFGLSTGIERAYGVKPEEMRARKEENPISNMAGQAAGLVGSSLLIPGGGAAGVMTRAGEVGAEALGMGAAETVAQKIGSAAVKGAIENMVYQGQDETAKMLMKDPNQSVQTAITDVGLSGLIGGGLGGTIGAVPELWKATIGKNVGGVLKGIQDKMGGVEGILPDEIHNALQVANIDVTPEVKAGLSGDPHISHMFQTLQESATSSGLKAQESLRKFKSQANEAMAGAFGKTSDQIHALSDMSEAEVGNSMKRQLVADLKAKIDPISEQFDKVREKFKSVELADVNKGEIADKIALMNQEKGYSLSPSSPGARIINDVISELPGLKSLEDLRKYQSIVGEKTADKQLWQLGKDLRGVFRDAEEKVLTDNMVAAGGKEMAAEALAKHAEARSAYRSAMDTVDELNDRLRVGRYNGPGSFIKALQDMSPEDIARRLSPKGDAGLINQLAEKFPAIATQVKDFQLNQVLRNAGRRAAPGEAINSKVLLDSIEKMSPEMRSFLMPEQTQAKLTAIQSLVDALPKRMNNSGTAKTLDSLWGHLPASAAAAATFLMGHNPIAAALVGKIADMVTRDVPDAARLALLQFLGSNKQLESQGFKSMAEFIRATIKGDNMVNNATKNIFKAGAKVLPESYLPTEKDRARLDKQLKALQENAEPLMDVGGKTGHYMPQHAQAMGETAGRAVSFINSQRPEAVRQAPLDSKLPPSSEKKAQFNRILDVAQQPLIVMDKVKAGTVTPAEISAMKQMYPDLYAKLSQNIMNDMTSHLAKDGEIPYRTRIGLSMFMGQALDSTMLPASIMAAQPQSQGGSNEMTAQPRPQEQQGGEAKKFQGDALKKLPGSYQTANQARQARSMRS